MSSLANLAQALALAYTSGINLYATVAVVGVGQRTGWLEPLPGVLGTLASPWVIGLATVLYLVEFAATLIPGVASAWETLHLFIRPPAAAALAAATAWHGDAGFVIAATLLGGGIAFTTHTTKLGVRYAIDTSPEPVTNGAANLAELGIVATLALLLWQHPYWALAIALVLLVVLVLTVRMIWRALRRVFTGHWMPGCGLLQDPRMPSGEHVVVAEED